jgi:predicted type IV restriction endonuclease
MVYYNVLVPFIASQLRDPGEKLVRLVAEEIPSIKRVDRKLIDRLTPILRTAIQSAILDHVARSFSPPTPLKPEGSPAPANQEMAGVGGNSQQPLPPRVVTTEEELEAYETIKRHCASSKFAAEYPVLYRDTADFFEINIGSPVRRWFIRAFFDAPRKSIVLPLAMEQVQRHCPGFETTAEGPIRSRNLATRVYLNNVKGLEKLQSLALFAYEEIVKEEASLASPRADGGDQSGNAPKG